MVRLMGLEIQ